jgi:hypothetical protein
MPSRTSTVARWGRLYGGSTELLEGSIAAHLELPKVPLVRGRCTQPVEH